MLISTFRTGHRNPQPTGEITHDTLRSSLDRGPSLHEERLRGDRDRRRPRRRATNLVRHRHPRRALVGSYYCADRVRQSDWHIVTALGIPLTLDGQPVNPVSEGAAVIVLTTILTSRDSFEAEQRLRDATHPPQG